MAAGRWEVSYDTKCYKLAEAFLLDDPEMCREEYHAGPLAQVIQAAIEEYLKDARRDFAKRHTSTSAGGA